MSQYKLTTALLALSESKVWWQARLEWDGGNYSGPISLVTVGNGALTGGLFYMTPHADPFDGKLTFVHAFRRTRWELLKTLPRTMKHGVGSYVELPGVHEIHVCRPGHSTARPG